MSKLFFALYILKSIIKSKFITFYLWIFGMNIGKGVRFYKAPVISGYLNKITLGNKCVLGEGLKIFVNKEGSLLIGDNTLISSNVTINAGVGKVTLGKNIMIASYTYIINNDHDMEDNLSLRKSGHITEDVAIEDNVWIAANCTILKGVTIGEGAVIGAGSVVVKDVPPYSINVGAPCKTLRNRFNKESLKEKLLHEGYDEERVTSILNRMK